jgi:hypothetical protein
LLAYIIVDFFLSLKFRILNQLFHSRRVFCIVICLLLFGSNKSTAQSISFSPDNGDIGNSFGVTVTGTGTSFLISTTTCVQIYTTPSTISLASVNVGSQTSLTGTVTIPPGTNAGTYNASVFRGPGCTGIQYNCTNCFTVNPCGSNMEICNNGIDDDCDGLVDENDSDCIGCTLFDFQNETIPTSWSNLDLDMNTDANGRPMNWFTVIDDQTTTPGDTNWVVAASSWFSPFAKAENWLIIGPIDITSDKYALSWKSAPFEGPTFADGYRVRISTTGNNPVDFTDTLAAFAESINGSSTWGPGIQHPTFNGNRGVLAPWTFNLAQYDGQSIYIAFQHDSNDDNQIMLDDIKICADRVIDAAIVGNAWPSEYSSVPLPQIRDCALNLGCTAKNNGDTIITQVSACLRIYRDSLTNLLKTLTSETVMTMDPGEEQDLVFADSFKAVANGTYIFEYIIKVAENDTINTNDTLRSFLIVNDTIMSRDDGMITGDLSIGAGTAGILGQNFLLKTPDTLYAADLFLTTPGVGDTISIVIYTANSVTGSPQTLVTTTPDRIITSDDALNVKLIRVTFPDPIALPAGAFYLGVKESTTGAATLATSLDIFTPNTTWVFFNDNWATNESYGFPVSYVLRPIFGACKDSLSLAGVISGTESHISYRAGWNITSSDLLKTGASDIYYHSGGTIDLIPGFTVENGVIWQTMSDGCLPSEMKSGGPASNATPRLISPILQQTISTATNGSGSSKSDPRLRFRR